MISRLSALDAFRGIAALGVALFWHYANFSPSLYPFRTKGYWFYHYGWNLVDFFFVLSGFVLSYVYMAKISDQRLSFQNFSILRLSRLYPLHIITLFVVAVFQGIIFAMTGKFVTYTFDDVYHFILNIFMLQSVGFESGFSFNGPAWSITCEILAYLLFFTVVKHTSKKHHLPVFITLVIAGITIQHTGINIPFVNNNTARVIIGFFIGCITYLAHKSIDRSIHRTAILTTCVFALSIPVSLAIVVGNKILGNWPLVYTIWFYPLAIILALNIKPIYQLLSIRPLTFLGDISYSVYLWNFPVQIAIHTYQVIFHVNINFISRVTFVSIALITISVATLSHYFFERPMRNVIRQKYLSNRSQSQIVVE